MPPQNAARAPSTELTGGTGFTFEGTAAATFLVSLLIEGSARGLFGYICTRVAFQQANFGEPLDDVIVDATRRMALQPGYHFKSSAALESVAPNQIRISARLS
jgi:hypothetical protein